jgi:hypothetical protein
MANQHFTIELKTNGKTAKWKRLSVTTLSPEAIKPSDYVQQYASDLQLNPDTIEARVIEISRDQIGSKTGDFIRIVSHHPSASQVNTPAEEKPVPAAVDPAVSRATAQFNLALLAGILVMGASGKHQVLKAVKAATDLMEIDEQLTALIADENNHHGVDYTQECDSLLMHAENVIESLGCAAMKVFFNDEIPLNRESGQPIGGSIRVEWEGSQWGAENPLYMAVPETNRIVW